MQFGVSESVAHWGKYRPSWPALYVSDGHLVTYGELNSVVDSVAFRVLAAAPDATRVAVTARAKSDLLTGLIGVLRAGKSVVVLNPGLPDHAIRTNLSDCEVSVLIHDAAHANIAGLIAPTGTALNFQQPLQASFNTQNILAGIQPRKPNDEWGVLFSSGTTGTPKGIERDHESIVTELLGWCLELGLTRHSSFYIGRPVFYTGGLVLSLATLLVSGTVFLPDQTDDNDATEAWTRYQEVAASRQLEWAFFLPDQIRAFCRLAEASREHIHSARSILVMGAPISGDEKVTAARVLQSIIVESWGNSESLGTITDPEDVETRPNSIGRPFLTDELCIVDEDGSPVPPQQVGRLAGSQDAGFSRYSSQPGETARIKRNNLIISDDVGCMDADGYFYVRGRVQDWIRGRTSHVFTPEVESKLKTHASVENCCVVGLPTPDGDFQLVAAVVVSADKVPDPALLEFQLNKHLGSDRPLDRVVIFKTLPRLPSGKVDKLAVAERIRAADGS